MSMTKEEFISVAKTLGTADFEQLVFLARYIESIETDKVNKAAVASGLLQAAGSNAK